MAVPLHLAVALDSAGWHPAAWRTAQARPAELFTAHYWAGLVPTAEAGKLDFVTIEDGLGPQSDRADHVQGRLDAVLIAARVGPVTGTSVSCRPRPSRTPSRSTSPKPSPPWTT